MAKFGVNANEVDVLRRRYIKWLIIAIIIWAGSFWAFRAFKISQIDKESDRVTSWLRTDVVEANPVSAKDWAYRKVNPADIKGDFGRGQLNWLGLTYITTILKTPSGAKITFMARIESSLTDTRLFDVELYYPDGGPLLDLEQGQPADTPRFPRGIKVDIPVETVGSGVPVNLRLLMPSAFAEPQPNDDEIRPADDEELLPLKKP